MCKIQRNMCNTQKKSCMQYTCAILWAILWANQINILCNTIQYLVWKRFNILWKSAIWWYWQYHDIGNQNNIAQCSIYCVTLRTIMEWLGLQMCTTCKIHSTLRDSAESVLMYHDVRRVNNNPFDVGSLNGPAAGRPMSTLPQGPVAAWHWTAWAPAGGRTEQGIC